jgi:TRAP-type mannitol/chloroaromatic compound transport system permease small subunit
MAEEQQKKPKICEILDAIVQHIGDAFSWLSILLVAAIIIQVILRYVFGRGLVILEELQFHFYGMMFMIAVSYALITNSHIRLDLLHANFSPRKKEIAEVFGIIFLLMPMIVIIFLHSLDFLADSWRVSERSDAPMGLPFRWAFKAFIPIGIGLLGVAAGSRLIRGIVFLFHKKSSKDHE